MIRPSWRHGAVLAATAALLGGCAAKQELRLAIAGARPAAPSAVAIVTDPADNPQAARFAAALADAFARSGHSIAADAPVIAVFGLGQRSRAIGMADGSAPQAAGTSEPAWFSAPGRKRAPGACKGERLRATLALYPRSGGDVIYRASGEIDGCAFAESDLAALAAALVTGAPR